MKIYLRKLNINDGKKELEYLKNLPENENGFCNPATVAELNNKESFQK